MLLDKLRVELRRLTIAQRNDARSFDGDSEIDEIETREAGEASLAPNSAAVFAYLDDTIMAGPPEIAGTALEAVAILAQGSSLEPWRAGWQHPTRGADLSDPLGDQRSAFAGLPIDMVDGLNA